MVTIMTALYLLSCALWASYAVRMQREKGYDKEGTWLHRGCAVWTANFVLMPVAMVFAIFKEHP